MVSNSSEAVLDETPLMAKWDLQFSTLFAYKENHPGLVFPERLRSGFGADQPISTYLPGYWADASRLLSWAHALFWNSNRPKLHLTNLTFWVKLHNYHNSHIRSGLISHCFEVGQGLAPALNTTTRRVSAGGADTSCCDVIDREVELGAG